MPEVILAGQGQFNNDKVRASVIDGSGNPVGDPVVSAEIAGIVRMKSCTA
jgi:hypothetical protein